LVTQHHQSQSYGQRSEQRPSTIDPALLQMRASTKNSQDRVRKDNVQRTWSWTHLQPSRSPKRQAPSAINQEKNCAARLEILDRQVLHLRREVWKLILRLHSHEIHRATLHFCLTLMCKNEVLSRYTALTTFSLANSSWKKKPKKHPSILLLWDTHDDWLSWITVNQERFQIPLAQLPENKADWSAQSIANDEDNRQDNQQASVVDGFRLNSQDSPTSLIPNVSCSSSWTHRYPSDVYSRRAGSNTWFVHNTIRS
jgi:hypothetical protein